MLTWLTKRCRFRAAIACSAIYAICVVAPSMALAFADSAVAAHCLTEDSRSLAHMHAQGDAGGVAHAHDDGTMHKHTADAAPALDDEGDQTKQAGSCCGFFCFVAVTGDLEVAVGQPLHVSVLPVLSDHLDGRGPNRINRPPIPFLSL
jgi:hypothetical protein